MKPRAWSHSALEDFVNCPKAFHAKRIAKTVQEEQSEQMIWGNKVHKAFELRIKDGTPLPDYLAEHEDYMQELLDMEGATFTERKVALSTSRQPCGYFDKDVWWRGILDYSNVFRDGALIVDYKTGKPHAKFRQLKQSAIHIFYEFSTVKFVTARYYWTKTKTETEETYTRDQIPEMWNELAPDLRQYVQAFRNNEWQARPSGLCNGWCPVTSCEHWAPKRRR